MAKAKSTFKSSCISESILFFVEMALERGSCLTRNHCWSHFPPLPLPQHVPSLLHPLHSAEQPCDPRTGGQSGRLEEQSPLTGFEPNTTVEIRSAAVSPIHLPSRRASFCSVYNSGEDATTTLVSSEVDERQNMVVLASPLLMHKSEARAAPARICHSTGESSMSGSSYIRNAGRPVAICSHKGKSSRRHSACERVRTEHQDVRAIRLLRADEAAEGEKTAFSRLSEAEGHTKLLLEEQRKQFLSEARSGDAHAGVEDRKCRQGPPRIEQVGLCQNHFLGSNELLLKKMFFVTCLETDF